MNTPTKITVSRIALIAVMLIAILVLGLIPNLSVPDIGNSKINWAYFAFTIVFVVAALTDALDGYLARKNNQVTNLGKFLDPIADKMLVNGMLVFLLIPQNYATNQFPKDSGAKIIMFTCVSLMLIRDLVVDTMRLMAAKKNTVVAANIFGKLKTVFQMIAIPALLLNDWPFFYIYQNLTRWPEALHISNILLYVATIMSIVSGIIYLIKGKDAFKEDDPKHEK